MKNDTPLSEVKVAEGAGFEPAVGVNLRTLSKRVPSTTQPPLLKAEFGQE